MARICDICGDVIKKKPVGLTMGFLERSAYFPSFEDEMELAAELRKYKEVVRCLFEMEICHNCALALPESLKALRKKMTTLPRVKQEVKNGHSKGDKE